MEEQLIEVVYELQDFPRLAKLSKAKFHDCIEPTGLVDNNKSDLYTDQTEDYILQMACNICSQLDTASQCLDTNEKVIGAIRSLVQGKIYFIEKRSILIEKIAFQGHLANELQYELECARAAIDFLNSIQARLEKKLCVFL